MRTEKIEKMKRQTQNTIYIASSLAIATLAANVMLNSASAQAVVDTNSVLNTNNPGLLLPSTSMNDPLRRIRQQSSGQVISQPELTPQEKVQFDFGKQAPQIGLENANNFFVNDIQFEGNSIVSTDQLKQLASPYLGQNTTLDQLSVLVEKVNQAYWDKGYLTTQAVIPPQDVSGGTLKIQVFEGRLGKLDLQGNKFTRSQLIMDKIDLKEGEVINFKNLENNLNQVNLQNRYNIKASLSPGSNTGETDVTLNVNEPSPWQVALTFDNQGRPAIGRLRGGAEIANYNMFGINDRANVRYLHGTGQDVILGSYAVPILPKYGTVAGISAGLSNVRLNGFEQITGIEGLGDPRGQGRDLSLFVSQPLDRKQMFIADASFNMRRITSYQTDPIDNTEFISNGDDIRSVALGLNFNRFDRYGRTYGRLANSFGFAGLGGDWNFWKIDGNLTRLFTLPHDQLIILRAIGQYTPNDLPAAEGFAIGGAYSVRGYTEGVIVGDRGYNLSAEYRWPIPFLKNLDPWWNDRLRGVLFVDWAQAFVDDSNRNFISDDSEFTTLGSVGAGLRYTINQYLSGFMDVGVGFYERNAVELDGSPSARVHFGIRSELVKDGLYGYGY